MIFGLFKKEQMADTVFINGNIYTQDADLPWAEAIACKDGKIIYVGNSEEAGNLIGPDTNAVDLGGKYMFPGFINTHAHPAMQLFKDTYISIPSSYDLDDILGMMSDYVFNNPEEDIYFGFGFDDELLKGFTQEEASEKLDEICNDKPMLLLSNTEKVLWVNNISLEQARTAAQQDGLLQISLQYFLQAVSPFNYEELQEKEVELMSRFCEKGFTSIFNAGCPEFMDSFYQDFVMNMCQHDNIKQRNFDSLKVIGKVSPKTVINRLIQKRTHMTEMDDYATCNVLKVVVGNSENTEPCTDESNLEAILDEASHRSFDIHIDIKDHESFVKCMEIVSNIRNSGFRKNIIVIACDKEIIKGSEQFCLEDMCMDNIFFVNPTLSEDEMGYTAIEGAQSIEEALDRITIDAAISLGMSHKLGSIEKGKFADLVVFEENPFDLAKVDMLKKLNATMTVVDGKIVYDSEEETMSEWYDLISGMQV